MSPRLRDPVVYVLAEGEQGNCSGWTEMYMVMIDSPIQYANLSGVAGLSYKRARRIRSILDDSQTLHRILPVTYLLS